MDRRLRLVAGTTLVVALSVPFVYVLSKPSSVDAVAQAERSDVFWNSVRVNAIESEHYDTLAALTRSADAVVLGRVVAARPGRVVHDRGAEAEGVDPRQADVFFLNLTVSVDEVLAGRSPGDRVTVEILVPNVELFGSLTKEYPSERAIFFLRDVALAAQLHGQPAGVVESLGGLYRLCTQDALVRDSNGLVHALDFGETEFLNDLGGTSFGAIVAEVRKAA
jgi:hypothetical protein